MARKNDKTPQEQTNQTPQAQNQTNKPQEQETAARTLVVRSERGLNLREGPAQGFGVRTVLADGAAVTPLELPDEASVPGWALVREQDTGVAGWAMAEFLREEG